MNIRSGMKGKSKAEELKEEEGEENEERNA